MSDASEKIFCNDCLRNTWHKIIHNYSISDSNDDVSWGTDYQIVSCQGCNHVGFRTVESSSENIDENGYYSTYTYYPPLVSRPKPTWIFCLPDNIRSVLGEVYIALHAGSRYLATVGARTAFDMMIVDKIGDVGSFKDKIDKLLADGHITASEVELIDAAIEAGNASTHRGFLPSSKNLNDVMDILETVLEKFYVAEFRQQQLAKQAADLKKKTPPRKQ